MSSNKSNSEKKKKRFFEKKDYLGYLNYKKIEELSERIVSWYNIKISDNIFIDDDEKLILNKESANYQNYINLTFDKLRERNRGLDFFYCDYDSLNSSNEFVIVKIFTTTGLLKNKIDKTCEIMADKHNGQITGIKGAYLLPKKLEGNYTDYTLDDIYDLLREKPFDNLDYYNLSSIVTKRKKDIITRNKIIKKICSELMFSCDNFEHGYYRAVCFLKDINKKYNLEFDKSFLKEIIDQERKKEAKEAKAVKKRS